MNLLKRLYFGYIVLFIILLVVDLWARYVQANFSISPLFYWMYLFAFVLAIFIWKLTSDFSMKLGFVLVLGGMFFSTIGLSGVAEVLFRLGLVGWMGGIIQALIEFGKENVKN